MFRLPIRDKPRIGSIAFETGRTDSWHQRAPGPLDSASRPSSYGGFFVASKTSAPSSTRIPEKSGAGPYIAGVVVLALLIGGLVYWRSGTGPEVPPAPVANEAPAQPPPEVAHFAPPPPPEIEEEPDAGADAAAATGPKVAGTGTTGGGSCGNCGAGKSSGALNSALSAMAGSAKGCYDRALRNSAVSGKLTVSVQVGSNGSVCGASIASDTVGSPEIRSCVLGRFQGQSFPKPESGCVVVNIPINFEIKN